MISLSEAHQQIGMLQTLTPAAVALEKALGLVCAEDTRAVSNCPTVDSSLKDGFAVVSADIVGASPMRPVTLSVVGALHAGDDTGGSEVIPGTAVRIMTGAPIPPGATAVLASEFSEVDGEKVIIRADARPGRNILFGGSDVQQGQVVLAKDEVLTPARLGLLSAAGLAEITCYPLPKIAIAATGSELVWPGEPIPPGKVAASNMITAAAELRRIGVAASTVLLRDNFDLLQEQFGRLVHDVDVLITCGGVLDGDKDLTMQAMEALGMKKIFHRVRMGPGKGACLGKIGGTVVFNLPGGPPSNHVALLLLALPGVRKLMGFADFLPPKLRVMMSETLTGPNGWTQLVYGKTRQEGDILFADPLFTRRRLEAMAVADILVEIPEGCNNVMAGDWAMAWLISPTFMNIFS